MTEDVYFKQSPKFVSRSIRGEEILVPIAGSPEQMDNIYLLNGTAAFVWKHACDGWPAKQIQAEFAKLFDVPLPQATEDVHSVLQELLEIQALVPIES